MEVVIGALQQQASILAVFRFAGFGSPAGLLAALGIPTISVCSVCSSAPGLNVCKVRAATFPFRTRER